MKTSIFLIFGITAGFFLLNNFSNPLWAQTHMKTYSTEWKKIDTLVLKKGLTKDALAVVRTIYNSALKEKNETQVLKSLIYQVMMEEQITENSFTESIKKLEGNLALVNGPAKSILNNLIAEKYWRFFHGNGFV